MTLLSTTFLIDLMRRDPPALELLRRLERGSHAIRVPTTVWHDLWEAAGRSRVPVRSMDRVDALLRGYAAVTIEPHHARRAGRIAAEHELPLRDALLYALAVEAREDVVVREGQDVPNIEGLRTLAY